MSTPRHHAGVQTDMDARHCPAAGTTSPLTSSFTALLLRLHQSTTHSAILSAVAKNATVPLLTLSEPLLCRREGHSILSAVHVVGVQRPHVPLSSAGALMVSTTLQDSSNRYWEAALRIFLGMAVQFHAVGAAVPSGHLLPCPASSNRALATSRLSAATPGQPQQAAAGHKLVVALSDTPQRATASCR